MTTETWYAHPNDLIGGWSVLNRDHPPSGLNRVDDRDGREVATFMSEADARRIADLHNTEALYVCESCPDNGWGCCGSWNGGADRRAFVAGRRRERERLAAAGRLLPDGGETRTEWEVWWHVGDEGGIALSERHLASREQAEQRGRKRIGEYAITRFTIHCRDHLIFADGSSFTGPWVEVTDA